MKRSSTLIVGALLATVAFTGCGDDDKSSGGSSGDYCARIAAYKAKSDELDVVFSDTPDPAKVEDAFVTMQTMISDMKNGAPAEIKADVITMSAAIDNVVAIFSKYDWDFTALAAAPDFAELQDQLAGADMQAASDRLEAYSTSVCGIASETTTA
ncbi:MAG: hypothetical protein KAY11_11225 [Ilumatobacteraceae bacterium]|jgi:hypothetical protein|nr:hypothetical protein [Acidimicrobiaceae bacterium]MBP6487414.1 hypothetical protein [Ilumatobacteraceae bacterium]MBP7888181.1 hypothetical protein [Ilumatobacteraceae bacterium]MBP8210126.1 hypothetical protein [Ilumatobacteraceae bacterium]HAN35296.1 hypothetical protein [Acidimicrobiaceae bacterium]